MKTRKRFWDYKCIAIVSTLIVFCTVSLSKAGTHEEEIDKYKFIESEFVGERITLKGSQSSLLIGVTVNLQLPKNHKLLLKAKPNIQLFTRNELIGKFTIQNNTSNFLIGKEILSDKLFAELDLYYCREGNTGLCIIKKVLYEIPIRKGVESQMLKIQYTVKDLEG